MVKTRMAPSPTGEYHIGHIRTILYNWAFARKNEGKFLIRIEDTDRTRFVEGASERILDVIRSYGFDWDEGPIFQSDRLPIYREYALKLVEAGHAYYCFCTEERLQELKDSQQAQKLARTRYDRHCLSLTPQEIAQKLEASTPFVIRLKVPDNESISFEDKVFGKITIASNDLDDQVLLKSDGFPTYHLAVVVDDHLMGVTHVMRGNDWLPSTPKHILLYRAFGWELPEYIHLPNLKEKGENKKLSKRYGAVFAIDFLREGYLEEALINFLMFIGWNPGTEKEIYSIDEFIKDFSIEKIHHTDLVAFDREKLAWFNGFYIRNTPTTLLLSKIYTWAERFSVPLVCKDREAQYNESVLELVKERMGVLADFNTRSSYFYTSPAVEAVELIKYADKEKALKTLTGLLEVYKKTENWIAEDLDTISHDYIVRENLTPKEAFMTLRVAVTGSTATPPISDICEVLGRASVLNRMAVSIDKLNSI